MEKEEKQKKSAIIKPKKKDKSIKDVNHKWADTNVKKRHLKKAGVARKNIFNSVDTTEKLLLIVTSVVKKIRDIGKDDIDGKQENTNG
jgi:hypothetical protein